MTSSIAGIGWPTTMGGKPQVYKTPRGCYSIQVGNACHHILLHLFGCHCDHGSPHQKAWWSCQSQWDIDGYAQEVISLQGPGCFYKTRWWCPLLCNGAPWWCFCPSAGNSQCISSLAGNSWCVGHWGGWALNVPYHGSLEKNPRVGSPKSTMASFPHGFSRFHQFGGSRWSHLHPMQWWFLHEDFLIGEWCQWFHWFSQLFHFTHAATWHGWSALGGWAFSGLNCKDFA